MGTVFSGLGSWQVNILCSGSRSDHCWGVAFSRCVLCSTARSRSWLLLRCKTWRQVDYEVVVFSGFEARGPARADHEQDLGTLVEHGWGVLRAEFVFVQVL